MAVTGHNGDNESFIGYSSSIGLSFYDENINEILISNAPNPIDIVISRDPSVSQNKYQYVNVSQIKLTTGSYFLLNGLKIKSINASIHIELKPLNSSIGYLLVMKKGYSPIVNSTYSDYDSFKLMCPSKDLNYFYFNCNAVLKRFIYDFKMI
jgi:hypothetical protein